MRYVQALFLEFEIRGLLSIPKRKIATEDVHPRSWNNPVHVQRLRDGLWGICEAERDGCSAMSPSPLRLGLLTGYFLAVT